MPSPMPREILSLSLRPWEYTFEVVELAELFSVPQGTGALSVIVDDEVAIDGVLRERVGFVARWTRCY